MSLPDPSFMPAEREELRFESIKESRGPYFVEYQPPGPASPFGILSLVITQRAEADQVAALLEKEAQQWVVRYPIPLMASAFDETESLISLDPVREGNDLYAFRTSGSDTAVLSWKTGDLDA